MQKKINKYISTALAITMVNIVVSPITSPALKGKVYADQGQQIPNAENDFEFDKGTKSIINYIGDSKDVVIPSTIGGVEVKHINDDVFIYKQLTSVVIPEGVISIGNHAFSNNELSNVSIPESIINIGTYAFQSNQLKSLVIPKAVKIIGGSAFALNPNLTSVTYSGTTSPSHDSSVYQECSSELKIYVPFGLLQSYKEKLSEYESKLTESEQELELPLKSMEITSQPTKQTYIVGEQLDLKGLEVTGTYDDDTTKPLDINSSDITGFDSSKLGKQTLTITVDGLTTTFEIEVVLDMGGGVIATLDGTTVTLKYSGEGTGKTNDYTSIDTSLSKIQISNLIIEEGVTGIGSKVFLNSHLTNATIAESVTSIGSYAFANSPLTSVTYKSTTPPTHGQGVFYYDLDLSRSKPKAYVPKGLEQAYITALEFQSIKVSTELGNLLDEIVISDKIEDNKKIDLPTLPEGVTATITSNVPDIISSEGDISPVAEDTSVTITIELTKGDATETKEYNIIVSKTRLGVLNKAISNQTLTNTLVKEVGDKLIIKTTASDLETIKTLSNLVIASFEYQDMDINKAKSLATSEKSQDRMASIDFIHNIGQISKIATYHTATRKVGFTDNTDNIVIKIVDKKNMLG